MRTTWTTGKYVDHVSRPVRRARVDVLVRSSPCQDYCNGHQLNAPGSREAQRSMKLLTQLHTDGPGFAHVRGPMGQL